MKNYNATNMRPFEVGFKTIVPTVFDDTLTYYEMLTKMCDYLNKLLADVRHVECDICNNQNAVAKVQELFNELQTYVNNYFKDLDVQQQINNKLDEMVIDGTLTEIVTPVLSSYVAAINQRIDYLSNYVTPQMFGATGNGTTDDTNGVIECLAYAYANKLTAYFPEGSYLTTQEIVQTGFPTVKMDGIIVYDGDGIALKFTRDTSVGTNGINHNLSLNVKRKTLSSAAGRDNIGIVIDSLSSSTVSIGLCENFDIGLKITTDNTRSTLLNRFFINDIKATTNCILLERTSPYAINGNNFHGGYLRKSGTYTDSEAIKINGGQNNFTGFYIESFYAAIHFANGSTNYARISAELCTNVQVVSGTANRNIVETIYPTNNAFVSDGNYVPFKSQTTFDAYIERVYTNRVAHHVLMDEYVNDGTNTAFTDCKFVNSSSGEFASYRSSFNVTFSGNIASFPTGSWAVAFTVNSESAKTFCVRSDLTTSGTQAFIVRLRDSNGNIITHEGNIKLSIGNLSVNTNWGGANGGVCKIPKDPTSGFSVFSVTDDVKYIDFIIPTGSQASVIDVYISQHETSVPIHENTSLPNAPTSVSYQGRTVFANNKIYIYDGTAWVAIT